MYKEKERKMETVTCISKYSPRIKYIKKSLKKKKKNQSTVQLF